MKNLIKISGCLLLISMTLPIGAQTIKRIKDPHIVAQEKRQVVSSWGDWKPKGKYFLGVQTNIHYTMVWGWMAPNRNDRYRKGADIRPLRTGGLQQQRMLSTLTQEQKTNAVLTEVNDIYSQALDEQAHVSSVFTSTDPLYILYYKDMLKEMDSFNVNSMNYRDWGFSNLEAFQRFERLGMMGDMKRKIEILQDKYRMAKSTTMARGKRIIMYHECLIDWRKHQSYLSYLDMQGVSRIKAQARLENLKRAKRDGINTRNRTDAEIFVDVFLEHGH